MNFTGSNVEKEISYLDLGKDLINGSKAEITVCKKFWGYSVKLKE